MNKDDAVGNYLIVAVEAALDAGWSPRRFLEETAACWEQESLERQRNAAKDFEQAMGRRVRV